MFVDSHCHLSFEGLHERIEDVLAAMAAAQVTRALCICTTVEEFDRVHALALAHDKLWCTAGVHPDSEAVHEPSESELMDLLARPRVVGVGETGLDYYRLNGRSVDEMAWQRERFRRHIRAARAVRKPLVVHTRSASDDTLRILSEEGAEAAGGVFHCFTETAAVARAALDMGFYISFSGILSFKNAQDLRDVAAWVPLDRCLIETDSPYLAPVPYRGKPNQPAYVPHVAAALAAAKGLSVEDVAHATTRNFDALFFPLGV
ncbi:MAG: TatD family hydrolase [Rubrivivax sp.]|nr:TatD family hydrolase [Rubrivivax sp.]